MENPPVRSGRIGRIDTFDHSKESWDAYSERLELFFVCNDVKDDKKVPALLSSVGGSTYTLLRGLTAPTKPKDIQYDDLVKLLQEHFNPKPLVIAERFRFHKREQKDGETIREFVAALRKLSEHCDFGISLNNSIRDRIVCGLRNEQIQRKLLSEAGLTLETTIEISTAMEAAQRDATELRGAMPVNKLCKSKPRQKFNRSQHKPRDKEACYRCGKKGHDPNDCYYKNEKCHHCGKVGHIKKACKKLAKEGAIKKVSYLESESEGEEYGIASIEMQMNSTTVTRDGHAPIMVHPKINGRTIPMELDTGSLVSVMTEKVYYEDLKGRKQDIKETRVSLKTYSGEKLQTQGVVKAEVEMDGHSKLLDMYIVKGGNSTLLGREWLKAIRLDWSRIKSLHTQQDPHNDHDLKEKLDKVIASHTSVFQDGWGTLKDLKATLTIKPDSHPRFCKARSVPYAIKPKVDAEIDRLVKQGILTRVDYSEWATPIVPVMKKDGSVRLCGDFKVTVNQALEVDQYPLPKAADIFASLAGGQKFTKLDLQHAYLQMEVKEESKHLLTINTEKGLYRFNRLVYGIASAPAIWQRAMDTVLQGLKGVQCIIDDMLITGRSTEEHLANLKSVLERLDKYGLRLRKDKCEFFKDKISFCGHDIDAEGLHKSEQKIKAMVEAPKPTNTSELRALLGLVNYYGRFLPNLATVLHPLHKLLEKDTKWIWGRDCDNAYREVKRLVTSEKVLTHYDPEKPVNLACDASPVGLGAVLSHIMEDGTERPPHRVCFQITEFCREKLCTD